MRNISISLIVFAISLSSLFAQSISDESDTKIRVLGSIIIEDPISYRQVIYQDWASIEVFQMVKSSLSSGFPRIRDPDAALNFIKSYIGNRISNDNRTFMIREGIVTAFYGKYIVVFDPNRVNFYINIVVSDRRSALIFRNERLPGNEDIPYGVSFEIWTEEEEIIGRDRVGDYSN